MKFIVTFVVLFCITFSAEAQFLNRLKDKVIERTTNVVIDKTADKAADEASKAMEGILNPNLDSLFNFGTSSMDVSNLPASYNFSYSYKVRMKSQGEEIDMEYLLSQNEPYFGAKAEMAPDMLMIFDTDNNAIVIKSGDAVFARALPEDTDIDSEEIDIYSKYSFSELPDKTFLGYNCKGYLMEDDENSFKVYIAPGVGVSFASFDSEKGLPANMPKEMAEFAKRYENGLMMFMEMEDKQSNRSDRITTMECISFNESDVSVKIR